ncbi:hypothetical protein QEH68_17605 [Paenarthrobacter sp. OM7]|uniref:hypothetical protein n=1 Tax=Paenarthrobacter sp. OM7 TaxID=3041264 RepID=UPI0024685E8E|nr:hypothetical protein [Paenarthrobacter sp. OM7]WGM19817.1 hypothetical protein QEH68_17605 [Paenarthrobacter sp. OM7]
MAQRGGDGVSNAGQINVELSQHEALVLFDWLARFNERKDVDLADQAERRILWDIECLLESVLIQPFSEDYALLLAAARSRLVGPSPS